MSLLYALAVFSAVILFLVAGWIMILLIAKAIEDNFYVLGLIVIIVCILVILAYAVSVW